MLVLWKLLRNNFAQAIADGGAFVQKPVQLLEAARRHRASVDPTQHFVCTTWSPELYGHG
jgi:hypothetical protein